MATAAACSSARQTHLYNKNLIRSGSTESPAKNHFFLIILMVWTIATYMSAAGTEPVLRWLRALPEDARAAIDDRLLMMEAMDKWPEKWASSYVGRPRIIELRIPHNKVQYRPLGAYCPHVRRRFVILCGAIEKGGKLPVANLNAADRRYQELVKDAACAKDYDYEA